ncbi:MAG: FAD-binding oxidoreductase [Actinomycetales bacterium]|nr:FAD-binding oxidoreductase [Actinomycetales bacterium]
MANLDDRPPFAGWGRPLPTLPRSAWEYLHDLLGAGHTSTASDPAHIAVPATRITDDQLAELQSSGVHIDATDEVRLRHVGGMAYRDLLAQRSGTTLLFPDAVAFPRTHDQVQALIDTCAQSNIAVVPFGGGTSVVGGLRVQVDDHVGVMAISTAQMQRVLDLDADAHLVRVQAGIRGPALEAQLAEHGLTLGHFPQSWERASVGGYAATRSSGQASTGYGRFSAMVHGLRLATPVGSWELGRAPASAAGPGMLDLALGSEGALGVITELTLRVRGLPAARHYEAALAPTFQSGIDAFRALAQAGVSATVMRLSDHQETVASLAMAGHDDAGLSTRVRHTLQTRVLRSRGFDPPTQRGALIILGWEAATTPLLRARRRAAWRLLHQHGVRGLGRSGGRSWERGRFAGPAVRDLLMDHGYLVETLESASTWSRVMALHVAVRDAITGALASDGCASFVMVHISHVYETGASLYWTVLAQAPADPDLAAAVWWRAKCAAMDAIVAEQGTITHHHAVGRDHAPWLADEVGDVGIAVLNAIRQAVDPPGVMNPGVLLSSRFSTG